MEPPPSVKHFIKRKAWQMKCQHRINEVFQPALDGTNSLEPGWGDMTLLPCILSQGVGVEVNDELILRSIA